MIQENAPGILNYDQAVEQDVKMIHEQYNDFPAALKEAITSYSEQSKALKEKS